ncbi:MAG TPA: flagellar basal body-associated FliL family protein [Acidobacteriota bacterium]|nr:flagellar basal body-associated FliL family protein [Acidobacteriota bacterium]
MAEKKDAKEAKDTASTGGTAAPVEAAAKAKAGGFKAWLPAIAAIILAPAATFGVAEYVLLPRLQAKLALPAVDPHAKAEHGSVAAEEPEEAEPEKEEKGGHGGKEGKEAAGGPNYEFTNVVVNLAGTMGTRYLKTSFIVTGVGGKSVRNAFETQKAKLTDITLNVLSSLTLADLEEPGSKNVLREKLVAAYNQALGKRLVDQVYFSDFVIQ